MRASIEILRDACAGLVGFLKRVSDELPEGGGPAQFRAALKAEIAAMEATSWLVPPMLQTR